MLLIH